MLSKTTVRPLLGGNEKKCSPSEHFGLERSPRTEFVSMVAISRQALLKPQLPTRPDLSETNIVVVRAENMRPRVSALLGERTGSSFAVLLRHIQEYSPIYHGMRSGSPIGCWISRRSKESRVVLVRGAMLPRVHIKQIQPRGYLVIRGKKQIRNLSEVQAKPRSTEGCSSGGDIGPLH